MMSPYNPTKSRLTCVITCPMFSKYYETRVYMQNNNARKIFECLLYCVW